MRHNANIPLWTAGLLAALAWPALAAGPQALEVTADDLAAAGVADVVAVEPAGDRFQPPVAYFRSSAKLADAAAKKDCADCEDLIAVFAADVAAAPAWNADGGTQYLKIGGRLQLRTYVAARKRIVTVTAPDEATLGKISAYLVAKFSK